MILGPGNSSRVCTVCLSPRTPGRSEGEAVCQGESHGDLGAIGLHCILKRLLVHYIQS